MFLQKYPIKNKKHFMTIVLTFFLVPVSYTFINLDPGSMKVKMSDYFCILKFKSNRYKNRYDDTFDCRHTIRIQKVKYFILTYIYCFSSLTKLEQIL